MGSKLQFCAWYVAYVAAIHLIPGPWQQWTSHGRTLDPWTATHLLWGFIGGKCQLSLPWLLAASCANEALEAYLRHIQFMGIWGDPETPINIGADLAATSLGWAISKKIFRSDFSGLADTQDGLAQDIIIMGDVKVEEARREDALANPARYLQSLGYVWEELPGSLQSFA